MGNDARKYILKRARGESTQRENLSDFSGDIYELRAIAAGLPAKSKTFFIWEINKFEKWLNKNKANKKMMRSAKSRVEKIREEMEKQK
jgi:hypothetical protein